MILLDTDHISVLAFPDSLPTVNLHGRLANATDPRIATTIITAAEQMRGWLARINRLAEVHRQVSAYDELADLFLFFQQWRSSGSTERRLTPTCNYARTRSASARTI